MQNVHKPWNAIMLTMMNSTVMGKTTKSKTHIENKYLPALANLHHVKYVFLLLSLIDSFSIYNFQTHLVSCQSRNSFTRHELHKLIIANDGSISLNKGKETTESAHQIKICKNKYRIFASFNVQGHLRMDKRYVLS